MKVVILGDSGEISTYKMYKFIPLNFKNHLISIQTQNNGEDILTCFYLFKTFIKFSPR